MGNVNFGFEDRITQKIDRSYFGQICKIKLSGNFFLGFNAAILKAQRTFKYLKSVGFNFEKKI